MANLELLAKQAHTPTYNPKPYSTENTPFFLRMIHNSL
jgi:hypothetical protein